MTTQAVIIQRVRNGVVVRSIPAPPLSGYGEDAAVFTDSGPEKDLVDCVAALLNSEPMNVRAEVEAVRAGLTDA